MKSTLKKLIYLLRHKPWREIPDVIAALLFQPWAFESMYANEVEFQARMESAWRNVPHETL